MADNVEIQGLEFQIVNDSTQTEQGLEALRNTLGRLRTACGSTATGLSGTAKSVRELKNALQGLNSGDVQQKITRIAGALNALGQVSNVKISSSVANQLTAISGAIDNLKWTDGDIIPLATAPLRRSMVLRTTGGSVLLVAASPTTSALSPAAATPTITAPAAAVACPSASAFNPRFHQHQSRPGRGGVERRECWRVSHQVHAWRKHYAVCGNRKTVGASCLFRLYQVSQTV